MIFLFVTLLSLSPAVVPKEWYGFPPELRNSDKLRNSVELRNSDNIVCDETKSVYLCRRQTKKSRCAPIETMCKRSPSSCEDELKENFKHGYCNKDECKKYGVPYEADGRWICILNRFMCNGYEEYKKFNIKVDEDICPNGGKCIADDYDYYTGELLTRRCECVDGFQGNDCLTKVVTTTIPVVETRIPVVDPTIPVVETTIPESSTAKPSPVKPAVIKKCSQMDKDTGKCSNTGNLCPFVDCPTCLPCQKKIVTKYETGEFEGCVKTDKCSEKTTIKLKEETCGECQFKDVVKGTGPEEGCEKEICKNDLSKCKTLNATVCQARIPSSGKNKCDFCEDLRNKFWNETTNPEETCEKSCRTLAEINGECVTKCKPWPETACDEKCKKIVIKNEDHDTCTRKVECVPKTCKEIATETGECVFKKDSGFLFHELGKACTCPEGHQRSDMPDHSCTGCKIANCEPIPCTAPVTCTKHEEEYPFYCKEEERKRCPDYCTKSKQCQCREAPRDCPDGLVLEKKDCPCDLHEKCCDKICPDDLREGDKPKTQKCVPESCEVCSNMAGAQLVSNVNWDNLEYCNSDKNCCTGCKDAKEVASCPSNWNEGKKKRCGCKK